MESEKHHNYFAMLQNIRKFMSTIFAIGLILGLSACANAQQQEASGSSPAKAQGAASSSEGTRQGYATRPTYRHSTPVTFTIGKTVIPVTLNDSVTARDLISRLPYDITLQRYPHDFCATMADPLKYDPADVHAGWMNGDVDFALTGPYFTILFENQQDSAQFGNDQVNIGRIDGPLSAVSHFSNAITIHIAKA